MKVPNLSSISDTVLYMYFGNLAATNQEDVANVWDGNYVGVWHLDEQVTDEVTDATGPHEDSTSPSFKSIIRFLYSPK